MPQQNRLSRMIEIGVEAQLNTTDLPRLVPPKCN
jgi:hypothetical protein